MSTVAEHYKHFLAKHYLWVFGVSYEEKIAEKKALLKSVAGSSVTWCGARSRQGAHAIETIEGDLAIASQGMFVITYCDLSGELAGLDRFFGVQADDSISFSASPAGAGFA